MARYTDRTSKKDIVRTNKLIKAPEVRVVDVEGNQLGVMPTADALNIAVEAGLDLVEVSAQATPPVCRVMDYGKYKYESSKKAKEAKKKQTIIRLKEVKLRPKTEEHDLQFKLRSAKKFLQGGDKVKVTIRFRGREITHKELGMKILKRIADELKDTATVESSPRLEGRTMTMLMAPVQQK
ncbi:MAG: translation initiation factor IF-3 [Thermodesulfobacteriota bacterium]